MSYLSRKRWLSRTTLGLAVTAALFAAVPRRRMTGAQGDPVSLARDADEGGRGSGRCCRVADAETARGPSDCAKADTQTSYEPADLEPTPQMWPLQDRD